jgi:hypothetical protein
MPLVKKKAGLGQWPSQKQTPGLLSPLPKTKIPFTPTFFREQDKLKRILVSGEKLPPLPVALWPNTQTQVWFGDMYSPPKISLLRRSWMMKLATWQVPRSIEGSVQPPGAKSKGHFDIGGWPTGPCLEDGEERTIEKLTNECPWAEGGRQRATQPPTSN